MDNSSSLKETIELTFSCNNLPDTDTFSKSDPCITVRMQMKGGGMGSTVGKTETIHNDLNPFFRKPLVVDYYFESIQTLTIICDDQDGKNDEDALGTATATLSSILMAPPSGAVIPLRGRFTKSNTTVTIKYNKIGESNQNVSFKVRCTKVKDIEVFSKSDPFIRIFRPATAHENSAANQIPENGWVQVHETEFYQDNLNPIFNPFIVDADILNRGRPNMYNRWEIWDHSHRGNHEYLGHVDITVAQMLNGGRMIETHDKKGKFSGNIHIDDVRIIRSFSISEYLRIGLNLSMTVGVDFTGSNGISSSTSSLHFIGGGPQRPNQYQMAILEVGQVLMGYDRDQMIPAYGFGAKLPGTYNTNFCFPLNLNPSNPFVKSHTGVLEAYCNTMPTLEFSGPTNFAPILKATIESVQGGFKSNKMTYTILLILTDGLISDFAETSEALVVASTLPMSVIIVGVGSEDFSQMNSLDADVQPLRDHKGNTAVRDVVQFVPFRDYAGNPSRMAEAVLRELPKQIDCFYQMNGIIPQ